MSAVVPRGHPFRLPCDLRQAIFNAQLSFLRLKADVPGRGRVRTVNGSEDAGASAKDEPITNGVNVDDAMFASGAGLSQIVLRRNGGADKNEAIEHRIFRQCLCDKHRQPAAAAESDERDRPIRVFALMPGDSLGDGFGAGFVRVEVGEVLE